MTDDQLRHALADLDTIDRAGMLRDLADEVEAVRRDWRHRRNNRTIGDDHRRELQAGDLAHLLGIDRDRCRIVARQQLSWPQTVIRVLSRMAAEARRRGGVR